MSILKTITTKEDWIESWKLKSGSRHSKEAAETSFKMFEKFLGEKYPDHDLKQIVEELYSLHKEPEFYKFLQDFIHFMQKRKTSPRTCRTYFMFVKSYLRAQGIRIYNDDIKQFVHFPKLVREMQRPLTKEHQRKLISEASKSMRAYLLGLSASGMRKSELLYIQVEDIKCPCSKCKILIQYNTTNENFYCDQCKQITNPKVVWVRIKAENTKTREEGYGFFTPEAFEAHRPFLKDKDQKEYVHIKNPNQYNERSIDVRFQELRRKCGLLEKYDDGKHYVVHIHAFRRFTFTEASKVFGTDYGHKLIRHHEYLDQYDQRTVEEIAEKYEQLIPQLTISNEKKLLDENEKLRLQTSKVSDLERKNAQYEDRLKRLEKITGIKL